MTDSLKQEGLRGKCTHPFHPFIMGGLAALVLPGCLTPRQMDATKTDVAIPPHWISGKPMEGPILPWVAAFEDHGLKNVIEESLQNNIDLQIAASRLEQAMAQTRAEGSYVFPQLEGAFNARRNQDRIQLPGAPRQLPVRSSRLGVSFDVSWELDVWGRVRNLKSASIARAQAAQADYDAARLSLMAQVSKVWFSAIEARNQLQLATQIQQIAEEMAKIAKERFKRGLISLKDLRLAESEVTTAASILSKNQRQLDASTRSLEVLLGRYPANHYVIPDKMITLKQGLPSGLPSDLVDRRADLQAAERRWAAYTKEVSAAKAALFPRFSITASGGTATDKLREVLDPKSIIWSIASNLTEPLWDGGRLLAELDLAKGKGREAMVTYAKALLNAFSEVEGALSSEESYLREERDLERFVHEKEQIFQNDTERFQKGVGDLLSALQSQKQVLDAKRQLAAIRLERIQNRINLHLALGGGEISGSRPSINTQSDEKRGEIPLKLPSPQLRISS